MIQRLVYSARVNIFENKRFYFGVLLVLTFHLVFRHSLIKIFVYDVENEWVFSRALIAILYGLTYVSCFFSMCSLNYKFPRLFFNFWIIIVCISISNELFFFINPSLKYDFTSSFLSGQAFVNARVTFPILFLGVWQAINISTFHTEQFIRFIKIIVLTNAVCICTGLIFDITFFESYPKSGRWGYSGFLIRDHSVVLSSIILIEELSKSKVSTRSVTLLTMSLLFLGTKSGLLSLALIFYLVLIKSIKIRFYIAGIVLVLLGTLPQWLNQVIAFNPFWNSVYIDHGAWGVLFSLRNESLILLYQIIQTEYNLLHWCFGGKIRFEEMKIEMLGFDVFVFYGIVGLVAFSYFFLKWIPSWKHAIPLLVALFSGSLLADSFLFVVWGVWIYKENLSKTIKAK